jgi:hypothetical protein
MPGKPAKKQSQRGTARKSALAPIKKTASATKKTARAKKPTTREVASKAAPGRRATKRALPQPKSGVIPRRHEAMVAEALQAMALPGLPQPAPGQAINLGIIAGTDGPTAGLGAGGTDLCEIAPSGLVALAGDTFPGNCMGCGPGSPSMALHVRAGTVNANTIQFDYSFGGNGTLYAEPPPHVPGGSQLPAGTVQVFGIDYALVTRTASLIPLDSRLVRINPNGPGWPTVPGSRRDASWEGGNQTQISGCHAPDGWVYIVADGFARDYTVRLYHCRAETFTDRNTWWAWGKRNGEWQWDVEPEPLSDYLFGELSLRLIEDKFVLSGFNQTTLNTEVRVADRVEEVLAPWTPVTIVATQQTVPQNYGGYIVPGSTLDQAVILVSQWNTTANNPYNVQQFVVNLNR